MLEKTPEKLMNYVLKRLKLRRYRIPVFRLRGMAFLARHTTVYQLKETSDLQTIALCDYQNQPLGNISIRGVPQIIDAPPIFKDGRRVNIRPALIMTKSADVWTRLHEICHLFSTGFYLSLSKNRFYHHFGICEFFYQLQNGQLERQLFAGHNGINELLTDYAAWHFMRLLYGNVSPFYSGTERFGKYADTLFGNHIRPEILLGWYFSGNSRNISELLSGGGYQDYETLYRALFER